MNKNIFVILLVSITLSACTSVKEGLTGSAKKGGDEFLVEKKAPLILPPDFGELPEPIIKKNKDLVLIKKNNLSFKELIDQNSTIKKNIAIKEEMSTLEKLIIKKINEK